MNRKKLEKLKKDVTSMHDTKVILEALYEIDKTLKRILDWMPTIEDLKELK